jgi:hypothetical protein
MKNVLAWALYLLLAPATGKLALPQVAELVPPNKSAEVYEAVILFQIKSWDLAADSYCVKINSRDADKTLLRQIQSPRVKPASLPSRDVFLTFLSRCAATRGCFLSNRFSRPSNFGQDGNTYGGSLEKSDLPHTAR